MGKKWLLISLSGFVLLILIAACAGSSTPEVEIDEPQALIVEKCGSCHSSDRVFNADYTPEEWSDVFVEMINKGADVTADEKAIMIDWLVSQE